jgi:hypothetical protein
MYCGIDTKHIIDNEIRLGQLPKKVNKRTLKRKKLLGLLFTKNAGISEIKMLVNIIILHILAGPAVQCREVFFFCCANLKSLLIVFFGEKSLICNFARLLACLHDCFPDGLSDGPCTFLPVC